MSTVALSGNHQIALTAEESNFTLWKTSNGEPLGFWNTESEILTAALSETGRYAIMGLSSKGLLIDTIKNEQLYTLSHKGSIRSVAISQVSYSLDPKDDQLIGLTSANDNSVTLWNLTLGTIIYQWAFPNVINHVNLSPGGEWCLLSSQHKRWLLRDCLDAESDDEDYLSINSKSTTVTASKFSTDGQSLLIGGSSRNIELWDIKTKKRIKQWKAAKKRAGSTYGARIMDVGFGNDQKTVYTITSKGIVYRWELPAPSE